jgi:hypothetical protein
MEPAAIETRRALYYPFIHPRDANWVKGTILAFGQLSRIVPDGYALNDLPEVAELAELAGPDGTPLVATISPCDGDLWDAQGRLLRALATRSLDDLTHRFGYEATREGEERATPFHIHAEKVFSDLLVWLSDNGLARPVREPRHDSWQRRSPLRRPGEWYALHPELGRAIMSVIAIAAARDRGLDVVTDVVPLHAAAAALDEDHVLLALLDGEGGRRPAVAPTQAADQLVHIVMTTGFDMSQLSVADVASLVADGMDLRRFKAAVASIARDVPAAAAPAVRDARLRAAAEKVLEDWKQYTRGLSPRLKRTLRQVTADSAKKSLDALGKSLTGIVAGTAAAGAATWSVQATVAGFVVGIAVAGVGSLLSRPGVADPLRYLSKVEKAGATLATVGATRPS